MDQRDENMDAFNPVLGVFHAACIPKVGEGGGNLFFERRIWRKHFLSFYFIFVNFCFGLVEKGNCLKVV